MSHWDQEKLRKIAYLLLALALFYRFVYPRKKPTFHFQSGITAPMRKGIDAGDAASSSAWKFLDNQDNATGVQAIVASLALIGIVLDLRATRASNAWDKQLFENSQTPKLVFRVHHEGDAKYRLVLLNTGGGEAIDVNFQAHFLEKERDRFTRAEIWPQLSAPMHSASLLGKERLAMDVFYPETLSNQFRLYGRCIDTFGREHRTHAWGVNNGFYEDPDFHSIVFDKPVYRMVLTSTHYRIESPSAPNPVWVSAFALIAYRAWQAGAFLDAQFELSSSLAKGKEKLREKMNKPKPSTTGERT